MSEVLINQHQNNKLLGASLRFDNYPKALDMLLPDYSYEAVVGNRYSKLSSGEVLVLSDVQAETAMQHGIGKYWYPQYAATVVIAVDRSRTDADIKGWRDLTLSGQRVGMPASVDIDRLIFGAVTYGLDRENFSKHTTLEFLSELRAEGHFKIDSFDTPVLICFDFQAVEMCRQMKEMEIIIPMEGTLSYSIGLLSDHELNFNGNTNQVLMDAGFRLTDGRTADDNYPDEEEYSRAIFLKNYDDFLIATNNYMRDMRRHVLYERVFSSCDRREDTIFSLLLICIAICWMGYIVHRVLRYDIKKMAVYICVIIVSWIFVKLFKYQLIDDSIISRMCWYSYYAFQSGLIILMLQLSIIVDKPEPDIKTKRLIRMPMALFVIIVLIVLTNDIHNQVFNISFNEIGHMEYSYGWFYYFIWAVSLLTFALSVIILIKKSLRSQQKGAWLFPAFFSMIIILYCVGYTFNILLIKYSDYTFTICVLAILFVESALHTGLIPCNSGYVRLFSDSPLKMQITDNNGHTVIASDYAYTVEPSMWRMLQMNMGKPVPISDDVLVYADPVKGGAVIWQEDISELNRIYSETARSVARIRTANSLLAEESRLQSQKLTTDARESMLTELGSETSDRITTLSLLISGLDDTLDREMHMSYITIMLCNIKRRCGLYFKTYEKPIMDIVELNTYIEEMCEMASYARIKALFRCRMEGTIDIRRAALCYDFFFLIIEGSARYGNQTIIGQLETEENKFIFSILAGSEMSEFRLSADFAALAAAAGGSDSYREFDDMLSILLTFNKGANENDSILSDVG